jgi:hypothetical protein
MDYFICFSTTMTPFTNRKTRSFLFNSIHKVPNSVKGEIWIS